MTHDSRYPVRAARAAALAALAALAACGVTPAAGGAASDPGGDTPTASLAGLPLCTGGDKTNLYAADDFDYTLQGDHALVTPSFTLYVCTDHFPVGSAARAEVELAIELYNNVAGTSAYIALGTAPHKSIAQLFPTSPTKSYFDVVDNSTIGFPCHGAGDTTGWAMNTCRHAQGGAWGGGSNPVDAFVISVNAANYTFDTDPTATDYPKYANIAHEIGHAFGMNHTADWTDTTSHVLLSTMQGNQSILPPHDRGYLRSFYPGVAGNTLNLVASPKIRLPSTSDSGFSNYDFAAVNPTDLYLSTAGVYYDCATDAEPVLQAQWLNHGQIATSCRVKNRFRIGPAGPEDSASKVTVKAWETAKMPAASQDRIATSVTITDTDLASLSTEVAYELTFMVDRDLAYTETDETDNLLTSPITLHASKTSCPLISVPRPPPPLDD